MSGFIGYHLLKRSWMLLITKYNRSLSHDINTKSTSWTEEDKKIQCETCSIFKNVIRGNEDVEFVKGSSRLKCRLLQDYYNVNFLNIRIQLNILEVFLFYLFFFLELGKTDSKNIPSCLTPLKSVLCLYVFGGFFKNVFIYLFVCRVLFSFTWIWLESRNQKFLQKHLP